MPKNYPDVKQGMEDHYNLIVTSEQIETYAQRHRVLKRDLLEDYLDTMTRELFIHFIVLDVMGDKWHWPTYGDDPAYKADFYSKFFPAAKEHAFEVGKLDQTFLG